MLAGLPHLYSWYLTSTPVWITTFHAIAVSLTLFRLYYRFSTHRWWYEDWFAFAGLLAEVDSVISVWIFTYPWTGAWELIGI